MNLETYYNNKIKKHGLDAKGLDGSQKSLDKRYKVLTDFDLTGKSILDVGCSWGPIGQYIKERHDIIGYEKMDYTGIDISKEAIELGTKEFPHLNLIHTSLEDFEPFDIMQNKTKQYDFVCAQGLFYRLPKTRDGFSEVIQIIKKMWSLTRETLAFCSLSSWAGPNMIDKDELLIDPVMMLAFIRENFTRDIVMRHDYLPHDCLFVMRREL